MPAKCPNKSHRDWKLMVRLFGEESALYYYNIFGDMPTLSIIAEIYKLDKGVELSDTNNPEVWDIEDSEALIGRWRTDKQGKSIPVKKAYNPYRAKALAKQLRDKYPKASFTVIKFDTEQANNNKIRVSVPLWESPDPGFKKLPGYEQRQLKGIPQREPLTPTERKDFERKKAIMLKTFPWVKEVIEDTNLINLGQVEQDGTIIRVNPIKMSKDTIGHEFGHLLIDVIGGLENSLVKSGLKQLEDTPLAKRIRDAYADKTETVIQKEILAEALGKDVAKLFEDEQSRAKWQNWLVRLFEKMKKFLGIEKGAVRRLSRMVLGSEEFNVIAPIVEEVYESRDTATAQAAEQAAAIKDPMLKLQMDVVDRLRTKLQISQRKGTELELAELEKRIDSILSEENSTKAMKTFVSYASSQTSNIYRSYEIAEKRARGGDKNAVNAKELLKWAEHVSAFEIVTDIEQALIEKFGMERYTKSPYLKDLRERIQGTITKKNTIQSFLQTKGIDIVADWVGPHTTRVTAEYKLRYEKAWRKMDKSTRPPKSEYMAQQLSKDEEVILDNTRIRIRAELAKGAFDIGYAYRFAENVLDSDDMVIASMAKAFALTMDKARHASIDRRNDLVDVVRELEQIKAQTASTSDAEFYEFIIEKDDKGKPTNKLVGKFRNEFWVAFNKKVSENRKIYEETVANYKAMKLDDTRRAFLIARAENIMHDANAVWKNEHAPVDKAGMMEGKETYVHELYKKGILDKLELGEAISAVRSPKYIEMFEALPNNESAANMIDKWGRENVWEYRQPKDQWKSKQYEKLMELRITNPNDARVKFFDLINKMIKEGEQSLPYRYRLRQSLPFVPKGLGERMAAGEDIKSVAKQRFSESFVGQAFDTEKGEVDESGNAVELRDENGNPKMFLPVFYTPKTVNPFKLVKGEKVEKTPEEITKEEKENLDTQSFDIASVYYNWYKMAMEYKYKSEVISEMELTKYLVEQREIIKLDSSRNPLKNANELLSKRVLTKAGASSMLALQLNDWFESVVYGKTIKDEGFIEILGTKIDKAKTVDKLNKYTAFNLLGLNMMQGVANKVLGEVMQVAEMFAGEHYNIKDYVKAGVQYNSNLVGIIGDVGERKPTNIINLMLEKFDILHDYSDPTNFNKSNKFRQLMSSNTVFFMAKAGEHSMQAKAMLAILNNMNALGKNGVALKNEDGSDMSLFDAFEVVDSKLTLNKNVDMSAEQVDLIGHQMKRLLSRMHGEYSDLGRVALQRHALGRMVYMFRKFMIQGWKRRWEMSSREDENGTRALKYNELGGKFTEGAYISTLKYISRFVKDFHQFKWDVFTEFAKNGGDINEVELANIKRTMAELGMFLLIFAMSKLVLSVEGDDEEDSLLLSHTTYQILRLKSELAFFTNPLEAMKILRSPAAAMSSIENLGKLFGTIFNLSDQFERGPWQDHYKWEKYGLNLFPIARQYPRILDVKNQINWFK